MADTKTSGLTELAATPAANDIIPIVDISDTSMAASGTTKYVQRSNLIAGLQASGNYVTALTGDVTASGPGSATATLASVVSAGSVGSSSQIPVLTYDAKGRITAVSTASPAASSPTPRLTFSDNMDNANSYNITGNVVLPTAGSGITALNRGATTTGSALINVPIYPYVTPVYDLNPEFTAFLDGGEFGASQGYECYVTFGGPGASNATINPFSGPKAASSGSKYIGFKIVHNAGEKIYAVHNDGINGETATLLTPASGSISFTTWVMSAVMVSATNIKFYINGTLEATHSSNLPTGAATDTLHGATGGGTAGSSNQNMVNLRKLSSSWNIH